MTKDEALQMCLEYIETDAHERRHVRWAIKDAMAQPELMHPELRKMWEDYFDKCFATFKHDHGIV
jgi:cyclopropane fatty-acyl-phospholipid synthase-like methyltransferase